MYGLGKLFGPTTSRSLNQEHLVLLYIFPSPCFWLKMSAGFLYLFFYRHTLTFQDFNWLLVKSRKIVMWNPKFINFWNTENFVYYIFLIRWMELDNWIKVTFFFLSVMYGNYDFLLSMDKCLDLKNRWFFIIIIFCHCLWNHS